MQHKIWLKLITFRLLTTVFQVNGRKTSKDVTKVPLKISACWGTGQYLYTKAICFVPGPGKVGVGTTAYLVITLSFWTCSRQPVCQTMTGSSHCETFRLHTPDGAPLDNVLCNPSLWYIGCLSTSHLEWRLCTNASHVIVLVLLMVYVFYHLANTVIEVAKGSPLLSRFLWLLTSASSKVNGC